MEEPWCSALDAKNGTIQVALRYLKDIEGYEIYLVLSDLPLTLSEVTSQNCTLVSFNTQGLFTLCTMQVFIHVTDYF